MDFVLSNELNYKYLIHTLVKLTGGVRRKTWFTLVAHIAQPYIGAKFNVLSLLMALA